MYIPRIMYYACYLIPFLMIDVIDKHRAVWYMVIIGVVVQSQSAPHPYLQLPLSNVASSTNQLASHIVTFKSLARECSGPGSSPVRVGAKVPRAL